MACRLAWSWAYSHCAGWRNHIPCSYWAHCSQSATWHSWLCSKKNPPLTRSKRKTGKNREIPQEFVAKQRLHSIKGDHQPLTPVPIDLQLGSPPHEIQAFNLGAIARLSSCWMAILRRYTILFRKLKFGDPWVLPKICLWPQDVVHGLQVILSSN